MSELTMAISFFTKLNAVLCTVISPVIKQRCAVDESQCHLFAYSYLPAVRESLRSVYSTFKLFS
jgi:hypothetical protein